MEPVLLFENPELYAGQYVALRSFSDRSVVTAAKTPQEVVAQAKEKGVPEPVLVFVPEKGMLNIY